jgi:hypothetical protein
VPKLRQCRSLSASREPEMLPRIRHQAIPSRQHFSLVVCAHFL